MQIKHRLLILGALLGSFAAGFAQTAKPVDMKLLVLSGDGSEPSYGALRFFLDSLGIPYDGVAIKNQPLPALTNTGNTKGLYQGIILTTGDLAYNSNGTWVAGLGADQWTTIENYMRDYKVRLVSYYTFPNTRFGLQPGTATGAISSAQFTSAAGNVFTYLNRNTPVQISGAWTYLGTLASPVTGEVTTPLLNVGTSPVVLLHTKPDGREYMAFTFDNAYFLKHSMLLNYGMLNWVTKGIFLGFRKVYLTTQSDDLFLGNDLYVDSKPECHPVGTAATDPTYDPTQKGCPEYRITGTELRNLASWQNGWRGKGLTKDFQVSMAFNGYGLTADGGAPLIDSLAIQALFERNTFIWINHTYDHENLDCYNAVPFSGVCTPATLSDSLFEINTNLSQVAFMGLNIDKTSMVTPNISGLNNPNFLAAAKQTGIKYLVSDASRSDFVPMRPNEGVWSPLEPSILYIPRRATSLFYNTMSGKVGANGSLPDEYNLFYGPGGLFKLNGADWFSTKQTYAQIIDRESDALLGYMLRYEIYPTMYHQSNFAAYEGKKSLFSDLIDATFTKYGQVMNVPVLSMTQTEIGKAIQDWMTYNAAKTDPGFTATLTPGASITVTATRNVTLPVTGICKQGCESYAGQSISHVPLTANATVTIPVK